MTEVALCGKWVSEGRFGYPCTRPAVEDGMCKQHVAGKKRSLAHDAKYREARLKEQEVKDATDALIAQLAELGVSASAYYSSISHTYTGVVLVDPQKLIDLLSLSTR